MNNKPMKMKLPILLVPAVFLLVTHLQARVWTSADGTSKTEAEFISARDGKVTFQKPGGQRITLKVIGILVRNLPVDEKRIYVTGYSMGGFGTFDIVAKEPGLFAAAVPVAGGGNPSTADSMKQVPFWVFHGDADTMVKVEQSRKMVEGLKKAGGKVNYTEIPGGSHGISGQVYQDKKVHEWMFEQVKGKEAEK